jgi:serine protease inhibitor
MSFGLKILSTEEGNAFISPINIAHAFSILALGADNETKKQIESLLIPLKVIVLFNDNTFTGCHVFTSIFNYGVT